MLRTPRRPWGAVAPVRGKAVIWGALYNFERVARLPDLTEQRSAAPLVLSCCFWGKQPHLARHVESVCRHVLPLLASLAVVARTRYKPV